MLKISLSVSRSLYHACFRKFESEGLTDQIGNRKQSTHAHLIIFENIFENSHTSYKENV